MQFLHLLVIKYPGVDKVSRVVNYTLQNKVLYSKNYFSYYNHNCASMMVFQYPFLTIFIVCLCLSHAPGGRGEGSEGPAQIFTKISVGWGHAFWTKSGWGYTISCFVAFLLSSFLKNYPLSTLCKYGLRKSIENN